MLHLSYQQYLSLIELRMKSELALKQMEVVSVPDPRAFIRCDYLELFNEVIDGVLNRYRNRAQ